ncbi:hypothetical protein Hbl1158_10165 [Halobaculum sp. CBA1158]|uniref:phage tail tube protein n=1 Tax=Halobaculum sp. CBA1158 TaxID=2904243 RepID=UPI001F3CB05E|nr:hypothetical protein [Halobaculum sp. CBA1158]UIO98898.1 hypothetical protein Hbl1158_10165 [Halobaculum sp. CBA1158]
MPVTTGSDVIINMQWESALADGAEADADPFVPGGNAVMDTNEVTNNGTRIYLPASNRAFDIKPGTFEGAWAISFDLTSPWFLRAILGSPTTVDNGDGTYTHTYDGDPEPFQLLEGYEGAGVERGVAGCIAQNVTVDPTVDEDTARVTMEGFFVDDGYDTPASLTSQAEISKSVLGYEHATLSLDGTEEKIVRDASLSLSANTRPYDGFGQRTSIDYFVGAFEPTIDYTKVEDDPSPTLDDVYGASGSVGTPSTKPLTLPFDNGETGSATNEIEFGCSLTFPESRSEDGAGDSDAALEQTLNRIIGDVVVDATNGNATAV